MKTISHILGILMLGAAATAGADVIPNQHIDSVGVGAYYESVLVTGDAGGEGDWTVTSTTVSINNGTYKYNASGAGSPQVTTLPTMLAVSIRSTRYIGGNFE